MEILTTGMVMIGGAALSALLVFRLSPEACETVASILLSRAAAHRASRKVYQETREKRALAVGGTITEDAILALLSEERPISAAHGVPFESVQYAQASLRARK